jgi:murein DD-endopeptidase MepM/ murein hydrolase activator NlpD
MRARFPFDLLVCLSLAVAAAGSISNASESPRATSPEPRGPLSPQPLIEVVAFGVAPVSGISAESRPRPRPGDVLHRPDAPDLQQARRGEVETRVVWGESWLDLFNRVGDKLNSAVLPGPAAIGRIDLLPVLAPGKYVRLRSDPGREAVEIEYIMHADEAYSIFLNPAAIQVRRHTSDPRLVEQMRADPAKASLFTATDVIGLPEAIVLQLAEIFSDEVDFHQELHYGYRCTIVHEVLYRDGHIAGPGRILAAEFIIRNRRLQAYYFDDGRGRAGYFTETGKSARKTFRRSPVEFSRVTSDYTLARFHPILGLWRAHRGIDYAAPAGSKAMATSEGVVEFMGDRGELGNLVILRHYGRFLTYYGHLNGFAENLAVGAKVEKGQVIGYVGMTGLATAPHLHYEFRVEDGSGNGIRIPVPPPEVLNEPPIRSQAFFRAVEAYRDKLQVAEKAHFVILD